MTEVLIDTEDNAAVEAALSALAPQLRVSPPGGPVTRTRIRRASLGSLDVDDIELGYDASFRVEPTDSLHLVCVRAGTVEYECGGEMRRLGPGRAGAIDGRTGQSTTGRVLRARFRLVSVNRSTLADATAGRGPVYLTDVDPVSEAANRQLVRVADFLWATATAGAGGGALATEAVERLVAATVLAALPTTALAAPSTSPPRGPTPPLLRQAIAFIEDHAIQDISLDDIAGSVYATPRALQYMFRKHRDCTPMEYLRNVRLDRARRDLLAGDPATTSVGEIARRFGVGHLGRFATNYRKRFGESPHETLRAPCRDE
jgi:AraC-like DNA-binding protein